MFLISDKDDPKDKTKSETHKILKERLGKRFYCLKCREIENLLTPEVLKKVIEEYEKNKPNFPNFRLKDYQNKYLGKFIEEKILDGKKTREGSYSTESGTISQKGKFCEKAIKHIATFEDLSKQAQELTKLIYEFIKENNR